jgi:enamine deaminase RidA (YjgF/YER057c/UK114 family)
MHRINISSDTIWESLYGYSRAVRTGPWVEVAGTAAVSGGEVMFPDDFYNQTSFILLKIQQALHDAGARMEDVVRTRIYVTDIDHADEVGRAHGEFFGEIRPASTMVEVYRLIGEGMVVEIEASAFISGQP